MELTSQIEALASRTPELMGSLQTEEATKNALVMPFIQALGYNVFDPTELIPEFTADVGDRKGEKVDYAILMDGRPIMLFECKSINFDLDEAHRKQLFRYFSVTEARIAVLTNGVEYRFYSDLDEPNKMDNRPFLEINLLNLSKHLLDELKKLSKDNFDLSQMLPAARDLKYTGEIKQFLNRELSIPSDDFIKLIAKEVYSGRVTSKVQDMFSGLIQKAAKQLVSERITERLEAAISAESTNDFPEGNQVSVESSESDKATNNKSDLETTPEELDAYHIARAILAEIVDPERITYRDTKRYFNVLLDNNGWRQICRFYFNAKSVKRIGLFDADEERKVEIKSVKDIYQYSSELKAAYQRYA